VRISTVAAGEGVGEPGEGVGLAGRRVDEGVGLGTVVVAGAGWEVFVGFCGRRGSCRHADRAARMITIRTLLIMVPPIGDYQA
jgi:hypothetical protein